MVSTTRTNKPINPRGNDQSPKGYNRAALYSGKALSFDGVNDNVNVGRPSFLNISDGAITLACYARIDATTDNDHLFRQENTSGQRILLAYQHNSTSITLGTYTNGSYGELDATLTDAQRVQLLNEIVFIVATQDANGRKVYFNGQLIDSDNATGGLTATNNADAYIGAHGASELWNGLIANFKIFNTALTAAQVADLYNNPEKVVPTGVDNTALKLWLPMQEGAGTTAYDGSSTENGPDLIVNGDFATDSDWTKGTGWTISGGVATHDSSLGPGDLYQEFNLTIGKSYKITIEITATDTTELYFMTDSGDYVEVSGSPIGVHSHVFVADDSLHRVGVRGSGNWDGSVDNITLEELNFANHGTISGATWTHGIGAPVSQTAVIDWNKGTNLLSRSENAEHANWGKFFLTATDGETDPLGTSRAFEITEDSTTNSRSLRSSDFSAVSGTQYYYSIIAKQGSGSRYLGFAGAGIAGASEMPVYDLQNGSVDTGASSVLVKSASIEAYGSDGWYKCSMVYEANATTTYQIWHTMCQNATDNGTGNYNYTGNGTSSIFLFAPILKVGSAEGVYVQTIATTQPNEVLLPQGLTSGRDITGVNLFENVRKQGALNLDGNSWAEVHDNASLDVTTGVTAEAWVYWVSPSASKGILSKWAAADFAWLFQARDNSSIRLYIRDGSNYLVESSTLTEGWRHLCATYDGVTLRMYVDGQADTTTAHTGSIDIIEEPVKIGAYGAITSTTYEHDIAQPRIYNRALTAEEVERNYNAGKNIYQ